MADKDVEAFENKCMDIIEKIVLIDIRNTRKEAIAIAEKMLEAAKKKTTKKSVLDIYERVIKEFKIATDQEYILLRNQLFS